MGDILVWTVHKQLTKLVYGNEHVMGLPAYEVNFQRPVGRCKCMVYLRNTEDYKLNTYILPIWVINFSVVNL